MRPPVLARAVALVAACALVGACRTPLYGPGPHEALNSALWMATSAEFQAAAEQAWHWARVRLDENLEPENAHLTAAPEQEGADSASLPPAVILDLDEAVLDNSVFEARMVRAGLRFDREGWEAWVQEARAPAIPGALAFGRYAAERGVQIFYVSNRHYMLEEATRRNLRELGFPVDDAGHAILSLEEGAGWASDKRSRRAFVAGRYRVVLVVGDDLNDFVAGSHADPEVRRALVERYADWWGTRWILIPNPVYGGWERALYGFDGEPGQREILRRKLERLEEHD